MKEKMKNIVSKINMKWLFFIIPVIIIFILIVVSSIFTVKEDNKKEIKDKKELEKEVIFLTKDNKVEFKSTNKYNFKNSEVSDYDLYIKDDKNQLTMAVFSYDLSTLEENSSKEILNNQISYFLKTRNDMKLFKEENVKKYEDKVVTTIEYSGQLSDTSECIYRFSSIDFNQDSNYILYITQVVVKKDYEKNMKIMQDLLKSAKLK